MITFEDVKKSEEVKTLIKYASKQLDEIGFTEHSFRHLETVSKRAEYVLTKLKYDERKIELAKIAGYLHDIGNSINRTDHAQSGAILAYDLLKNMGMDLSEAAEIMMSIGNHDEKTGSAVSTVSAALILADKSDVHRTRVKNTNESTFGIHDRVNYAVEESNLIIDGDKKIATLDLTINTQICPVIDYFEIFMERTIMSKRAAKYLNVWFELIINGTKLL